MKKTLLLVCTLLFTIHESQTYYSQDFETGGFNGWISNDLDGDGDDWYLSYKNHINSEFGYLSLTSNSYYTSLNSTTPPNNLITSPLINLSSVTGSNLYMLYDMATSPNWPAEKYSVYITTVNTSAAIIASTPVYTETVVVGGYQKRAVNLTPYIGQQIYISFRHYDCYDQNFLVIDNIQIKTLPASDFSLNKVELSKYGVINTDYFLKTKVKNNSSQPMTSVNMTWNDGTASHNATMALSSPINPGFEGTVIHSIPVKYPSLVEKNITVTINQANGTSDSNISDNTLNTQFKTISQFSPKKVLVEEGSGTWCGWCPKGIVAMRNMDTNYPNNYIGIVVHNDDPMTVPEYDTGAGMVLFPSFNVDRVTLWEALEERAMENRIISRKDLIVPVQLQASGSISGNMLTLNASAVFRTYFTNANFRLAAILVEDNVKGTTSTYAQHNYYAGGGSGPMGGFENLPALIPASQMEHNHVGRMLLGGYEGPPGSVPATISDGQVASYTFTAAIPSTMNMGKMKAVVVLLNATTGEVVNARSFVLNTLGTNEAETDKNYLTVYPNPTAEFFKVQSDYNTDIKIYDASGKMVLEKYNVAPDTPVSVQSLVNGTYIVSLKEKGAVPVTKKLIVSR